ncbi:MAG: hypothetical protein K4H23_04925 [Mollicutes bacterium PWAP]|nr:hypothetical protein [Mollicutes bacterium PWAP]
MSWNHDVTITTIAELIGTMLLLIGVTATIYGTKKSGLEGIKIRLVQGAGIALSLMLAVYAAQAIEQTSGIDEKKLTGWVNPAVALFAGIGHGFNNEFENAAIVASIGAQFVGATLGLFAMMGLLYIAQMNNPEEKETIKSLFSVEKENISSIVKKDIFGEMASSFIFLGGVAAAAVFGTASVVLAGFIVGLSIFLAIISLGGKFNQLFNPAAGFATVIGSLVSNKSDKKTAFLRYGLTLIGNISAAGIIGVSYYGLKNI